LAQGVSRIPLKIQTVKQYVQKSELANA